MLQEFPLLPLFPFNYPADYSVDFRLLYLFELLELTRRCLIELGWCLVRCKITSVYSATICLHYALAQTLCFRCKKNDICMIS